MSKKAVVTAVVVCLLLALAGGGILGWLYISRDRAAVASYTLQIPEETNFADLVKKESELMKSDAVLQPVIGQLDLLERWKMDTEEEALVRLRAKLKIKADSLENRIKVIYKDRSQQRALEVLEAINRQFGEVRRTAAARNEVPPVLPPKEAQP